MLMMKFKCNKTGSSLFEIENKLNALKHCIVYLSSSFRNMHKPNWEIDPQWLPHAFAPLVVFDAWDCESTKWSLQPTDGNGIEYGDRLWCNSCNTRRDILARPGFSGFLTEVKWINQPFNQWLFGREFQTCKSETPFTSVKRVFAPLDVKFFAINQKCVAKSRRSCWVHTVEHVYSKRDQNDQVQSVAYSHLRKNHKERLNWLKKTLNLL